MMNLYIGLLSFEESFFKEKAKMSGRKRKIRILDGYRFF